MISYFWQNGWIDLRRFGHNDQKYVIESRDLTRTYANISIQAQ